MSEYLYKRNWNDELNEYYDANKNTYPIANRIHDAIPNNKFVLSFDDTYIKISFENTLTDNEEEILDNIIVTLNNQYPDLILEYVKQEKIKEIKSNQRFLEKIGFEWPEGSGDRFAMDAISTTSWNGMIIAVQAGKMEFPQPIRTTTDKVVYLNNAEEALSFYSSGLHGKAYMYYLTAQYVNTIKSYTTITDVLNFHDPRLDNVDLDSIEVE